MAVIDIADPTNPGTPFYQDTTGDARDVCVSGDYTYIADGSSGLAVIDISDPTNPGTPVYENTTDRAFGVYVSGNYAYRGDWRSGLAIIDISDPTNPGTPVYEDTPSYARDIYVSGDYAYVTDEYSGLVVMQVRRRVDMEDPTITNAPSNITIEYGYTGVKISWVTTDTYPNNYTITLAGTGIVAGPTAWASGVAITYNVPSGLAVGAYFYTVNFTDDYDNHITNTIKMTVIGVDMVVPIIVISVSITTAIVCYIVIRKKKRLKRERLHD